MIKSQKFPSFLFSMLSEVLVDFGDQMMILTTTVIVDYSFSSKVAVTRSLLSFFLSLFLKNVSLWRGPGLVGYYKFRCIELKNQAELAHIDVTFCAIQSPDRQVVQVLIWASVFVWQYMFYFTRAWLSANGAVAVSGYDFPTVALTLQARG